MYLLLFIGKNCQQSSYLRFSYFKRFSTGGILRKLRYFVHGLQWLVVKSKNYSCCEQERAIMTTTWANCWQLGVGVINNKKYAVTGNKKELRAITDITNKKR